MLNDYEGALAAHEQVIQICRTQPMPLAVAQAEYNIAYLHYFRGAYGRAIEMLRTALRTSRSVGDSYHTALCHLDLSEIYLELNMNEHAAQLAQEASSSFQRLNMGYEAAKALCNLAIAFTQQGRGFAALELFTQARAMFVKEENQVWPFHIDLYQALAYFSEGRLPESRRYCKAALEFFQGSALQGRAILCRLLLARLSLKTGEIEGARQECQTAFRDLAGMQAPILVYQAHLVLGQIEEAAHNRSEAERHYRATKDILDTLRSGLHGEELKISFMRNRPEVYENLVDLTLARDSTPRSREEAWNYMEQAKSRSLLELLARLGEPHGGRWITRRRIGAAGR